MSNCVNPKVSVCMLAYNNSDYVDQAIRSVLSQEIDFPVELVISEDASTDDVREKIRRYSDRGLITIVKHFNSCNLGLTKNLAQAISMCRGEYIAYLDNDDYWSDNLKLKKQVDALDLNPDASLCFHPVLLLQNGKINKDSIRPVPKLTGITELASGNYIRSNSAMFRSSAFHGFPESYYKSPVNDYFLFMLVAKNGSIIRLSDVMAVYRLHNSSDWSSRKNQDIYILDYIESMIGNFGESIDSILIRRHQNISYNIFKTSIEDELKFEEYLSRCLKFGSSVIQQQLSKSIRRAEVWDVTYWKRILKWWWRRLHG